MKINEITEGILDKVANKVAGKVIPDKDTANPYGAFAQQIDRNPYGSFSQQFARTIRDAGEGNPFTQYLKIDPMKKQRDGTSADTDTPQPDADTSTDNEQPNTQQPRQQQQRQQQTRPQGNPNQNINTKIDYLKSIGVLQSARITDSEKQYIESTDVWVDSNKLQDIDPSTTFFQTRAPHHHMFLRQIVVPGRDLGYDNNVNYQYSLTPAGWWSPMHNGYINPNSKLGQLVDNWAESH
jgi:hypothetical protein